MIEIVKDLIDKVNRIRNEKNQITFIQIGAYDGVSMDDIGNIILRHNDKGIFLEPNQYIIDVLRENKKNYIYSKILPYAIIPDKNFYHKHFHIHKNGGGSSFLRGLINGETSPDINFEVSNVEIMTVEYFWKNFVDFDVDILITDCEGYDFDINKKILSFCKPRIIYMEAWDTKNLNTEQKITSRDDMISFMKENNYDVYFDNIGENLICYLQ